MNPTLVLDLGGGCLKIGFSTDRKPRYHTLSFLFWFPMVRIIDNCIFKSKTLSGRTFVANEIEECNNLSSLYCIMPFKKGYLNSWDIQTQILDTAFKKVFKESINSQVSCAPIVRRSLDDNAAMNNSPPLAAALLAAYKYQAESVQRLSRYCMVIDSGYSFTHLLPMGDGRIMSDFVLRLCWWENFDESSGRNCLISVSYSNSPHLCPHLSHLDVRSEVYIMNQCKEDVCYVSTDFWADLSTAKSNPNKNPILREYVLPDYAEVHRGYVRDPNADGGTIQSNSSGTMGFKRSTQQGYVLRLNNERFTVPELLFHPGDVGYREMGLTEAIGYLMCERLPPAVRPGAWANCLVIGGNARFPGFLERLKLDLRCLPADDLAVNVFSPTKERAVVKMNIEVYGRQALLGGHLGPSIGVLSRLWKFQYLLIHDNTMQLLDLLNKTDCDFREHLDDTLVNRLCSAVACHGAEHGGIFHSGDWEQQLGKFFSTAQIERLCGDENGMKVLKLSFVVLLSYGNCASSELSSIRQIFESYLSTTHFPKFGIAILEATDCYLKRCCTLADLGVVDSIFDDAVPQLLHNSILCRSNIHQRQFFIELLAHLCVYNQNSSQTGCPNRIIHLLTGQLCELTEFSLSFLFRLNKIASTFSVCMFPISLPSKFPLNETNVQNCSLPYLANILFLFCMELLNFEDDLDIISLFSHFNPFPVLCAQTIGVYLRSGMHVSGDLWNRVVSSWSEAVVDNIANSAFICKIINPVTNASVGSGRHQNHVKIECKILNLVWTEVFSTESAESQTHRLRLVKLLRVLVHPELGATQLDGWLERLWFHIEKLSACLSDSESVAELEAVLCLGVEICRILFAQGQNKSVVSYVHKLHALTIRHKDGTLFYPCMHTLAQLIRETKLPVNHGDFSVILFSSLECILCSSGPENEVLFWDRETLARDCSNILLDLTVAADWPDSTQAGFVQLMTSLLSNDPEPCAVPLQFDCRITLLCVYLRFVASLLRCPIKDATQSIDWLLHAGSYLLNFNTSEYVGWEFTVREAVQHSYDRLLQ
ncbi:Actin, partial [Opisthorchis viverrini]